VDLDFVAVVWGIDDAVNDKTDDKDKKYDTRVGGLGNVEDLTTLVQLYHWVQVLNNHLDDEVSTDQDLDLVAGELIEELVMAHLSVVWTWIDLRLLRDPCGRWQSGTCSCALTKYHRIRFLQAAKGPRARSICTLPKTLPKKEKKDEAREDKYSLAVCCGPEVTIAAGEID